MQNTIIWNTATPLVTSEHVDLCWRRDWSVFSPSWHFLCLALSPPLPLSPCLLPQSDGPNVRVHPRERRKIVKINELLFSLAVRPTDRATALPLPRQLSSCLPAVRWTVKEGRKDGKSGGEWERTTILILPFLPLLRASDNPSGGSNSLFEGQFHRLCRSGDGNTSWTLLSPISLPLRFPRAGAGCKKWAC